MKKIALLLLMFPAIAYSEQAVPTKNLTPIVKFQEQSFHLKDKRGNVYLAETDCDIKVNEMTEFTVQQRQVKEGTKIRFSKKQICSIEKFKLL